MLSTSLPSSFAVESTDILSDHVLFVHSQHHGGSFSHCDVEAYDSISRVVVTAFGLWLLLLLKTSNLRMFQLAQVYMSEKQAALWLQLVAKVMLYLSGSRDLR